MDRVSKILPHVLRSKGLKEHADAALVLHRAQDWIGENLREFRTMISANSLQEDGTLLLACTDSAAAQECTGALPHLKVFLREECGFLPVRTIRIVRTPRLTR